MTNPFVDRVKVRITEAQRSITAGTVDVRDLWILLDQIEHVLSIMDENQSAILRAIMGREPSGRP